jgi:hypothetical protein
MLALLPGDRQPVQVKNDIQEVPFCRFSSGTERTDDRAGRVLILWTSRRQALGYAGRMPVF